MEILTNIKINDGKKHQTLQNGVLERTSNALVSSANSQSWIDYYHRQNLHDYGASESADGQSEVDWNIAPLWGALGHYRINSKRHNKKQ